MKPDKDAGFERAVIITLLMLLGSYIAESGWERLCFALGSAIWGVIALLRKFTSSDP